MSRPSANRSHWDKLYASKPEAEYSWFQDYPEISMELLRFARLPKSTRIIDVGGGDSRFADALLASGFDQISVLDISLKALEKAQQRLGPESKKITWIHSDVCEFKPEPDQFDCWHDRAAFHFLTEALQVDRYVEVAARAVRTGGFLILGTFAPDGPEKCSGLEIKRYGKNEMEACFSPYFEPLTCKSHLHTTPFQTIQHFNFCCFRRKENGVSPE